MKRAVRPDSEVIDLCSDEEGRSPVANAFTPEHPEVERPDPAPVQPLQLFLPTHCDEYVKNPNGVHVLGSPATATILPLPMLTNVADEPNPKALQVIAESDSKDYDLSLQSAIEQSVDSNPMLDTETQFTPFDDPDVDLAILRPSSSDSQGPGHTTSLLVNELDRSRTSSPPSGEDFSAPGSNDQIRVEAAGFLDDGNSQHTQPGSADEYSKAALSTTPERATPDEAIFSHSPVALESSSPISYRDDARASSVSQRGGGASDGSPQIAIQTFTNRVAVASLGFTNVETFDEPKESTEASLLDAAPSILNRSSPAAQADTCPGSPSVEHKDSNDVDKEVKIASDDLQLGNETQNSLSFRQRHHIRHDRRHSSCNSLTSHTHAAPDAHDTAPPTIKRFVPWLLTPRFFAQSFLPPRQSHSSTANPEANAAERSARVDLAETTDPTVCDNSPILSESLVTSMSPEDGQVKPARQTSPIASPSPSLSSLFQKADSESARGGSRPPENDFIGAAPSSDLVAQLAGGNECVSSPSSQQPVLTEAAPASPSESSHDSRTTLEAPLPRLTSPRAPKVHPFFIQTPSPADMLPDVYTLNILNIPALSFTDGDDDDIYLLTHCFDYPDLEVVKINHT